jgi:hypothetical protein
VTSSGLVRTPDAVVARLIYLNGIGDYTFRKIARLDEFSPIPAGTLCAIAKGYPVPKKWRPRLGLSSDATVSVISGEVPPGSQVIGAIQCGCGKWFVPNSGKRLKCYECTKPRKRK